MSIEKRMGADRSRRREAPNGHGAEAGLRTNTIAGLSLAPLVHVAWFAGASVFRRG